MREQASLPFLFILLLGISVSIIPIAHAQNDKNPLRSRLMVPSLTDRALQQLPKINVGMQFSRSGPVLASLPRLKVGPNKKFIGQSNDGNYLVFTPNRVLQSKGDLLMQRVKAPHAAFVAMDPFSGKILAIGGKSGSIPDIELHSGFPAASLFKIITAAAAVELTNVNSASTVAYRGGTYTLNKYNYLPNSRKDRKTMTVGDAMGKSCNPVFGRLALALGSPAPLRDYALLMGFNLDLTGHLSQSKSTAKVPTEPYKLSRTGAGFGEVTISPIHAAALMSSVANGGYLPSPVFVDEVYDKKGKLLFKAIPNRRRILSTSTAQELLSMMENTITTGTAKRDFTRGKGKRVLPYKVSGKTGTLTGKNPKGLTRWFIASAPTLQSKIVVAVVVVNPRRTTDRPTYIARELFKSYLGT